jgi:hypothetical protein
MSGERMTDSRIVNPAVPPKRRRTALSVLLGLALIVGCWGLPWIDWSSGTWDTPTHLGMSRGWADVIEALLFTAIIVADQITRAPRAAVGRRVER